jgi:hypothetical protein
MLLNETTLNPKTREIAVLMCTILEDLERLARLKGISLKGYDENSLKCFLALPEPKQKILTHAVTDYLEIVARVPGALDPFEKISVEHEIKYLSLALRRYGLRTRDQDFDFLKDGDIIEVYNSDWIQLYRNFEFFRHCSYTLLDLICNEVYVLYERPQQIVESMIKFCTEVLANGRETVPYMVPVHILRERYLNARKAFRIQFKYVSPLIDASGKTVAILSTLRADLISEGPETSKIHMI